MNQAIFPAGDLVRALSEATQEALLAIEQGVIRFANRAACRMTAAPQPDSLVGRPIEVIFDQATCAKLAAADAVDLSLTTNIRRLDGTLLKAQVQATILDSEGERRLLSLAPFLADTPCLDSMWVLESMPVGIVVIDQGGTMRMVNAALERMFGYRRTELLGQEVEILLPERLRSDHAGLRAAYGQSPAPRAMGQGRTLFALGADGVEFPVEIGLNPVHMPHGVMVLAAIVEVTARKDMETAFKRLVETAPYGVIMANTDGQIVLVNAMTENLLGYERQELLGRPLEMLLPERVRSGHPTHRQAYYAEPSARAMGSGRDLTALRKNGTEVAVEIGLTPIQWDDEAMVVATIGDISARKALRELTHVVTQELKSRLQSLSSLVDSIGEQLGGKESQTVRDGLTRVRNEFGHLNSLIDDLLP